MVYIVVFYYNLTRNSIAELHKAGTVQHVRNYRVAALSLMVCFGLAACAEVVPEIFDPKKHDYIDRPMELSREDYRTPARPIENGPPSERSGVSSSIPAVPAMAQILAAPKPPEIGEAKLVSIAVTDDVPLKDVLIELARLADVDVELDAGISGGISFRAKDRPFNEVIDRIADLAGLRYTMKNGVLRVERDTPFVKSYPVDFLNVNRSSDSNITINTNVLSAGGGGGSSGGDSGSSGGDSGGSSGGGGGSGGLSTGSTASIKSITESDFWRQLDLGIKEILSFVPAERMSTASTLAADGFQSATGVPPSDPAASGSDPNATNLEGGSKPFYILNRQAGVLTVSASDRQHRMIQTFLDKIRRNASAQVLIEAKIVEVALTEQYQTGIDWSALGDTLDVESKFGNQGVFGLPPFSGELITFSVTDNFNGHALSSIIRLAENFGTTRTLSSPRLHAINNQTAVLTFARNEVYFEVQVERESNTSSGTTQNFFNVSSSIKTVPIGIILSIQPSINLESNEVTLNVHPTLSSLKDRVDDPAVAFLVAQAQASGDAADLTGIKNEIPVVEVRELDSILKLKSGQIMVIGGLMEQTSANQDKGVPYADRVPFLGNLVKGVSKTSGVSELIILIKATVVGSNGNAADADKVIYEKFSDDPRPLAF